MSKKSSRKQAHKIDKEEETLKELKKENRRLRREIDTLHLELEEIKGEASQSKNDFVHSEFEKQAQNEYLFSKNRYSAYIYDQIRRTSVFQVYAKIIRSVRRFTFIKTTLKILAILLGAIESSAIFVISASFFVISLPFTLFISNATLILTFFKGKQINAANKERILEKKVTILFPQKGHPFTPNSYFCSMAEDIAKDESNFCIIVSPYFWSSTGLHGKKGKPFLASRLEKDNILMIRRHYFFTLKKKVLSSSAHITEIY